jgi:hypothetical protein
MEDKMKWRKPSLKSWIIVGQPECEAQYWWLVDENEDVMAKQYILSRTYVLPAYIADWILQHK